MAEAVARRVAGALAEVQTQVAGGQLIAQGPQRHQALHFTEEQAEDAFDVEAGLQLQAQLLAQLGQADRAQRLRAVAGKAQALQFGGVEIDGVGLAVGDHGEPLALSAATVGIKRIACQVRYFVKKALFIRGLKLAFSDLWRAFAGSLAWLLAI